MWSFRLLGKYKQSLINLKDNNLKPLSCKVKNNMETTIHMNEFKFHKPGK